MSASIRELMDDRKVAFARLDALKREFERESFSDVDRFERERMQRHASILGNLVMVLDQRISAAGGVGVDDPWWRKFMLRGRV